MSRITKLLIIFLTISVLISSAYAQSDTRVVNSGIFTPQTGSARYHIVGDRFDLQGGLENLDVQCGNGNCFEDKATNFDQVYSQDEGSGSGTFDGTTYDTFHMGGRIILRTDTVAIPSTDADFTLNVPFRIGQGDYSAYTRVSNQLLFKTSLVGQGIATIKLHPFCAGCSGGRLYGAQSLEFTFLQPTRIVDPRSYVSQQYRDFLSRAADTNGLDFWTNQIAECGGDAQCVEVRRINVSAAFLLSIEFQQTGYTVERLYKASLGRRPAYSEFLPYTQVLGQNVTVGAPGWEQQLETNRAALFQGWVEGVKFKNLYGSKTDEQFVDQLIANTEATFTNAERDALVNGLKNTTETRASVLRQVVEEQAFIRKEYNPAFVLMQYFGYLRRDPDEAGFNFWLAKLNRFNGDFVNAEMVKAFITSQEYNARFPVQ